MNDDVKIIAVGNSRLLLVEENGHARLPQDAEVVFEGGEGLFTFGGYQAFDIASCSPVLLSKKESGASCSPVLLSKKESGASCSPVLLSGKLKEMPLREAFGLISHADWEAAAKGAELVGWDHDTRFCAACGAELRRNSEISKICPQCGKEYFPVLNVAILVLVTRGEEALLVHARNFRSNFHALVAGFVETGETLEQCVAREVREETSLEVDDVRYFGSQSWPFPRQLMIGFTARYKSGEIRFADGELTSGGFFTRENHPPLPTPPSLSRMIIDSWLKK